VLISLLPNVVLAVLSLAYGARVVVYSVVLRRRDEAMATNPATGDLSRELRDSIPGDRTLPVDRTLPQHVVPGAAIDLYRKHSLAVRWMHWINFPLLFLMIWSGLLIYWADSDPRTGHLSAVYRVGIGHWTLFRLFPQHWYAALGMQYLVPNGLAFHFFFMWLFALNGLTYVTYLAFSGEWRTLVPPLDRLGQSLRDAWGVVLFDLHLRKIEPTRRKYNAAQKFAYTGVVLMGGVMLVTGFAIYKPTSAHWLTALTGGYEMARWLHFWTTMGFLAFFVVHIAQVVLAGWNNFRSMITGYEVQSSSRQEKEDADVD
jgi:thiosulfate reductase cytochrome b subunit